MKNILLFILTVLIGSNCFSQEVVVFFFAYENDEVIPFDLDQELLIKLKIEEITIGAAEDIVITLDQLNSLAKMDEVLSGLK